jgi:glyoxylase-like metal-dependent hydrolase (beta-lactamase superfamily II)/8-oxo-dGTP pyrophosphatase MutT (NUDIX family)
VSTPTAAASVLLARGPGSPEVYIVRRAEKLRAFGGFIAFPGGKVAPADCTLLPCHPRCVTGARELFEETGVLVARRPDETFPPSSAELDGLRRELVDERLTFGSLLGRLNLHVDPRDFVPIGTFITPSFATLRFDTAFLLAELPPGQHPEIWAGELEEGRWTTADALLQEWTRGGCLVSPPTLVMLEAVQGRAVAEMPSRMARHFEALAGGVIPPIFYAPQVQLIPLRTLALAPSAHTNAYVVGRDPAYLLDPGPSEADEQQRLFALLDEARAGGLRLGAIVLTHHHSDHIGAAQVSAQRYGVPIWADAWTARKLKDRLSVARELREGDRLDLGNAPDGRGPWHLEALHTPGHAPGHLAFYEPYYRLLFAGDMVSTLSSVVIAPPEGDLTVYLDSLARLRTLPSRLLLPAHGSPSASPERTIEEAIEHRRKREEQLLEALADGARTIAELGPELYKGLPSELMGFAELQILAGLQKLERECKVQALGVGDAAHWQTLLPA